MSLRGVGSCQHVKGLCLEPVVNERRTACGGACVCTCVGVYGCICACIFVHACRCVHICTCLRTLMCAHMHVYFCMQVYVHVGLCVCAYVCACVCVACVQVCMHTQTCACSGTAGHESLCVSTPTILHTLQGMWLDMCLRLWGGQGVLQLCLCSI